MKMRILFIAVCLSALTLPYFAHAADIVVQPAEVRLAGPNARQQLLVLARDGTQIVGDRTATAKFASSNPAVAKVDEAGNVTPFGDGDAVISAILEGKTATATVHVTKVKEPVA